MPSAEELEQLRLKEEMEANLDPMEISRLHQMLKAAETMDAQDAEVEDGD